MVTRIIYPKFWQDSYICKLSNDEKLAFIYFITNEKVNILGIYELPDKYILADLNISPDKLLKIKEKFSRENKFKFFDGWVKVVNFEKYNNFIGEKNTNAKKRLLAMISDTVLKNLDTVSIEYPYCMDTPLNHKSEIINHKSIINREIFLKNKEQFLEEAEKKYPDKNCKKALEDFVGKTGAKDYGYKNYKLAFFNWVREDTFGKYKIQNDVIGNKTTLGIN